MNFKQWCKLDEMLYVCQTDEEFKQYAGMDYNEELIVQLAEMRRLNSKTYIESFPNHDESLFLGAVEEIAYSKTKAQELEIHRLRNTDIVSNKHMFNGVPVNWSNWRQFNSQEKVDLKRKEVFDEFIEKTKKISSIVESRFSIMNQTYDEYSEVAQSNFGCRLTPVSAYMVNENFEGDSLIEFVKSLGERARIPFRKALRDASKELLNRDPEYYDDFYFFRNRIYSDIEEAFSYLDPVNEVKKVLKLMNFDLSNIRFDTENRKDKYPSPICFFVEIPSDVRVLYKRESPYFDFQGCLHETGHAIHATSIDDNCCYSEKYRISMGIAEIFSMFFERLSRNPSYLNSLQSEVKSDIQIDRIIAKNNFMDLYFITFYTANSLMKIEYWEKSLNTDWTSHLYSKLLRNYLGFDMPGEYWLLHHILPEAIMYVPSYLIAAVRAFELEKYVISKFGEKWWKEKDAGEEIRKIMNPGAKLDMSIFSRLDTGSYMKDLCTAQ
jgi:carboxypeptidase Taq (M32) metallopeptidase